MKYLFLLPIAVFSLALEAQTATSSAAAANESSATSVSREAVGSSTTAGASAAGQATSRAGQAALSSTSSSSTSSSSTNVAAELTKKIDTKHAKVGDAVEARTTSAAKFVDGTKLPRGTKLLGKVTEIQARSSADPNSHLAFTLDRAVLRDGREIPVHAVLTSVTGRAAVAGAGDDIGMPSAPVMAGGGVSGGGRGGMLGGVGRTAGGVGSAANGVVGGAANTVDSTAGNLGAATQQQAALVGRDAGAAAGVANSTGSGVALDHVPVANLPGVALSNMTSATGSGSLDAAGRNIILDSGTQMTLNVSASQQQASH